MAPHTIRDLVSGGFQNKVFPRGQIKRVILSVHFVDEIRTLLPARFGDLNVRGKHLKPRPKCGGKN